MARLEPHALLVAVGIALGDRPAAIVFREPRDERRDRIRQRLLNRLRGRLQRAEPAASVRLRHRQRDHRRLRCVFVAPGLQAFIAGLQGRVVRDHVTAERRVHEPLHRRHAAIACRQLQRSTSLRLQRVAHAPIRVDTGTAEAIDRLLRVADDEELAGGAAGQQQKNVGLNRIRVLEFVDEDARELGLQMAAHGLVRLDQIARLREQVAEVERAR